MSKGNGLSKFFKGKEAAKVAISDEAKQKPTPRSKDEINKQYQEVCTMLGDKQVKAKGLQQEIDQLFTYVTSLGNELDARLKLDGDAKRAEEAAAKAAGTELAPATTGVDADAQA